MKIAIVDQLSFELETQMEKGLTEYEQSHGIDVNYHPFSLIIYNDTNEVVGILEAFSSYSCVHIRDLWVDINHRGHGYGKKLIKELEQHVKGKGFHNINTVSCDFQAPDFYKKCGFDIEFVRENKHNPKLTMTFFIKHLD